MDSLLSSYASSDDDEPSPPQQPHNHPQNHQEQDFDDFPSNPLSKSSKFSLPPPKSLYSAPKSNLFNTHQPKQEHSDSAKDEIEFNHQENHKNSKSLTFNHQEKSKSLSLFSSIPQPKANLGKQNLISPLTYESSSSKKVVRFRPPVNQGLSNVDEDEDEEDDEEEKERKRKKAELGEQTPSVKSFLSSIPAPRNSVTLGALGSGLGTGRRSVIDADVQASNLGSGDCESEVGVSGRGGEIFVGGESGAVEYVNSGDYSSLGTGNENYANVDGYSGYGEGGGNVDYADWNVGSADCSSNVSDSGNYGSYGQYVNNWTEGCSASASEVPIERALRLPAKRGRKDNPPQIIEVNQDELMKNRPREDQAKMTGIAFGPAYQPASSKGKPSKLHKRKHQIGALYFDMKQKETELAERRSKGFLTKAQTQGKYGW